jgi:isoquinoline 1-oxidoreductase subunit beta
MKLPPKMQWRITRRRFLLIGAGAMGVLGVGAYAGFKAIIPTLVDGITGEEGGGSGSTKPLLWFGVDPKQGVTLYVPKGEMGQGVQSMMAQLAAEELELEPTQLQIVLANSSQGFDSLHGTYGRRQICAKCCGLKQPNNLVCLLPKSWQHRGLVFLEKTPIKNLNMAKL